MTNERNESAVGKVLRQHGVGPDGPISVREAERRTGVSRQTLGSWLRPVDPNNPIRHTKKNLDLVADGLNIDRAALGLASMIDNGGQPVNVPNDKDVILSRLFDMQRRLRELESDVTQVIVTYMERATTSHDV